MNYLGKTITSSSLKVEPLINFLLASERFLAGTLWYVLNPLNLKIKSFFCGIPAITTFFLAITYFIGITTINTLLFNIHELGGK